MQAACTDRSETYDDRDVIDEPLVDGIRNQRDDERHDGECQDGALRIARRGHGRRSLYVRRHIGTGDRRHSIYSGFPKRPHGRKISSRITMPKDAYAATEPP